MLSCAQPCQCILSQPVDRATFAHRQQCGLFGAAENVLNFGDFEVQIELPLLSRAHFSDLAFQKCSKCESFAPFWNCKSSSRYGPAHFLSTTFPDRAAEPRKQRPYCGDPRSHFSEKTPGFAPKSVSTREFTCSHDDGWWHDHGWHDGGNANHDNRP